MTFIFVVNLSSVGHEDSSSEEGDKRIQPKPVAPPRTRSVNTEPNIRKMTNNKEKPKSK